MGFPQDWELSDEEEAIWQQINDEMVAEAEAERAARAALQAEFDGAGGDGEPTDEEELAQPASCDE